MNDQQKFWFVSWLVCFEARVAGGSGMSATGRGKAEVPVQCASYLQRHMNRYIFGINLNKVRKGQFSSQQFETGVHTLIPVHRSRIYFFH